MLLIGGSVLLFSVCFFFFNDTATTEIYTLSLHDALPILHAGIADNGRRRHGSAQTHMQDRKSTRLNSSHTVISYAVLCLKKKNKNKKLPYNTGLSETNPRHRETVERS